MVYIWFNNPTRCQYFSHLIIIFPALNHVPILLSLQIRRGGVRQNTTVFISYLLGWRHISATVGHPQVTKIYNEEKIYSIRTLVVVHILSFQRDLVETSEYAQQLVFLYCVFSPHYIFLWPEDGAQWPKHVISQISRIQRLLCFDVPLPLLICIKHNGDYASKDCSHCLFCSLLKFNPVLDQV